MKDRNAFIPPVIDPTLNVQALNEASVKRVDDLREAQDRLIGERIDSLRREMELRAKHSEELRKLETGRLDAIRQFDVQAANTAADRAQLAIQALATNSATMAETLRAMVDNSAKAIATQTAATMATVNERLSSLERFQYEGKGKSAGLSMGWGILIGAVVLLGGIAGLIGLLQ